MSYVCLRFPFFEFFINKFIYSISLYSIFLIHSASFLENSFFSPFFNTAQTSHIRLALHACTCMCWPRSVIEHKTFFAIFHIFLCFHFQTTKDCLFLSFSFFLSFFSIHLLWVTVIIFDLY